MTLFSILYTLLLHYFNVFGYNSTSIVMLVCFYCYLSSAVFFFSHLSFCKCKGSTAENCSEEASRFGKRNVKPINKLIGSTKWLWITTPMNETHPLFSLKTLTVMTLARKHSKYDVPSSLYKIMLLLQNKSWLIRHKKKRAMSFLPSVECGRFKLKTAFQSGKILACRAY